VWNRIKTANVFESAEGVLHINEAEQFSCQALGGRKKRGFKRKKLIQEAQPRKRLQTPLLSELVRVVVETADL
jgi:hypothetical protein